MLLVLVQLWWKLICLLNDAGICSSRRQWAKLVKFLFNWIKKGLNDARAYRYTWQEINCNYLKCKNINLNRTDYFMCFFVTTSVYTLNLRLKLNELNHWTAEPCSLITSVKLIVCLYNLYWQYPVSTGSHQEHI